MTTQHNDLAAQALLYAERLEKSNSGHAMVHQAALILRQCAAALEREQHAAQPEAAAETSQQDIQREAHDAWRNRHINEVGFFPRTQDAWHAALASTKEQERVPLSEALDLIANWPITDRKNMDAMSMQGIAQGALGIGVKGAGHG